MNKKIPITQSSMPPFEEFIDEIKDLWSSHWLTNMGVKHKQFEKALLEYLKVENITLFTNGHLALESIIEAFNLTGEIITTPFTFASTTHAIVRKGLNPVFCDINHDDYTIDSNRIEALITEKTSAIIPVHIYGNVCNVEKIEKIAKKHNLKVIYDAAHAFGTKINEQSLASFGDATMFSFHATKVFNTIEGGCVTYSDKNLTKKLNAIKNFGIVNENSIEYAGGNAKMNEFQAAMGLCNLRYVVGEIEKRKNIVNKYRELLSDINGIKIMEIQNNVESNYAYFPIIFNDYARTRDFIYDKLKENNISSFKYFHQLTNSLKCYNCTFDIHKTPIAAYIAKNVLALPLYSQMDIDDVEKICNIITAE